MDTSLTAYRQLKESTLFMLFFFMIWFFCPVACIFLFALLLYKFKFSKNVELWILLLMALSFGLVGYTAQSTGATDSDIARYNFLYSYVATVNSAQTFFISFVIDGGNNLLFYLVTFLMTRLFPGNPQILPLFWVSVTYFFSFLTIKQCSYYFRLPRQVYILLLFISFMGVITFYTTTEIIKQTASVSVFMYALMLKLQQKKGALSAVIISVLIHFSSLLLLPIYFVCRKHSFFKYLPIIFFFCFILSFFNFNILLYNILSLFLGSSSDLLNRVQHYEDVQTWTISVRFYALFVVYFIFVVLFYWDYYITQNEQEKNNKKSLLIIHACAVCILLVNRNNVHNFIRYTLGYFPFYILAVIQLFRTSIARFDKQLLIVFIFGFYIFSNIKMLMAQTSSADYSNSYMNNDVLRILTSNVIQYLNFRTTN